jgi:hypothetical protein
MIIGEGMNDGLFVAQINFIIGRVYNIKQENERSIYFHEKHLNLARQFQDSKGQYRAYFILSQLYEKINQSDKAKKYLSLYKSLAREVDKSNDGKNNFLKVCLKYFSNNIYLIFFCQIQNLRAESISINIPESSTPQPPRSYSVVTNPTEEKSKKMKLNFMQHLTKKSPLIIRKQVRKKIKEK